MINDIEDEWVADYSTDSRRGMGHDVESLRRGVTACQILGFG